MKKRWIQIISVLLISSLIACDVAYTTPRLARSTLAPPTDFATSGNGSMTSSDLARQEALQKEALFHDISLIIGRYLHVGISGYTLLSTIEQHVDAIQRNLGESFTRKFLAEYKIDELFFNKKENAYYLPIYQNGAIAFYYKFYIHKTPNDSPDEVITIDEKRTFYVKKVARASRKSVPVITELEKRAEAKPITLEDGSKIVVVGGGPAGSFFAIEALRKAKALGKKIEVIIMEKKKELQFYPSEFPMAHREGCNYCAGIISPRMASILEDMGLVLPESIVQGRVKYLTVQGHWKSIELRVPDERQMYLVYRGARPIKRTDRHQNFDSFLLETAIKEGARVITGEVKDAEYTEDDKVSLNYKTKDSTGKIEADFAVFAGGVNQVPGSTVATNGLVSSLHKILPDFVPPETRRGLIFELEGDEDFVKSMGSELYFLEYGSEDLRIEMGSMIPKGRFITVVLIGPSIDNAKPNERLDIVKKFLDLPQIKKVLSKKVKLATICICNPNMTIGAAKTPFGHRAAVIGDLATSRLYKDGIFSAYMTAYSLVDAIFGKGIDKDSLAQNYWPTIKVFKQDSWFGRLVFMANRITFSNPTLSRFLYQAIITERKTMDKDKRRLTNILWRIASGDDNYISIFLSMIHPFTIWQIIVGGALMTLRNYLTEQIFGLNWHGIGRYPTGVYREDKIRKRKEFAKSLKLPQLDRKPDFEKIYSIKIRAPKERILHQLGKFGDEDRQYLNPRFIDVRRIEGGPNKIGSVLRYNIPFPFEKLSASIRLEDIVDRRFLVYRVIDGFAKGGVIIFDIEPIQRGGYLLSIYVGFDFPKNKSLIKRFLWFVFNKKRIFPGFIHDVLWNHALCRLKDLVEEEPSSPSPQEPQGQDTVRDTPQELQSPEPPQVQQEQRSIEEEYAIRFRDIVKIIQDKNEHKEFVIFALGTDWIKGYEKGVCLKYDVINPLIAEMRKFCEARGITFIIDDEANLAAAISIEKANRKDRRVKTICLASEASIRSNAFDDLRNDKNAFLVGVNSEKLTIDSYTPLIEMATCALYLAFGLPIEPDNIKLLVKMDKPNLYIFIPEAVPMEYEKLRETYTAQIYA